MGLCLFETLIYRGGGIIFLPKKGGRRGEGSFRSAAYEGGRVWENPTF
jgi:hypothetical protein